MAAVYGSFFLLDGEAHQSTSGGQSVALIRIEGLISDSNLSGLFEVDGTGPEETIEQLRLADEDPEVAAILLRINSGGGTVAASQEIYRELRRVTKPVVASIGDMGASGAYYIASASDKIVASPSSAVGSIGVILEAPNYVDLLKKVGIEYVVITSGQYKDIGNPARRLSPEEMSILKTDSDVAYQQFIDDVAKGRNIKRKKVEGWANGLVYPGVKARKMGMIDTIGNYQDAIDLAGELGKIVGEPEVVEYGEPTVIELLTRAWQGRLGGGNLFASLFQTLLHQNQFQAK